MVSLSSKKIDLDFCNYIGNMCVVPLYFGKSIRIKCSNFNRFQISLKHTKTTSCFQFFSRQKLSKFSAVNSIHRRKRVNLFP